MTRAERRYLRSTRRKLHRLTSHRVAVARSHARRGLQLIEQAEHDDPRPPLLLRLRLRLTGVDAG